jgi:hypothetical protein
MNADYAFQVIEQINDMLGVRAMAPQICLGAEYLTL